MKINKFQVVVLAIFAFGVLGGLVTLALVKGNTSETALPEITVWGTFPKDTFQNQVAFMNQNRSEQLVINYVQKDQAGFAGELTEALAQGSGPDAVLIPQEMVLSMENKFMTIPYTAMDARTYKNTYIEQAELYLREKGFIGLPFSIDPLVMYWNRDMFTNAGIATYPKVWDDFLPVVEKINQRDINSNIRKSTLSLGEFSNIQNAREIFSLLLLQAGNPIVSDMQSTLSDVSTERALNFFIGFANPSSPAYSWNRSLPNSKTFFLAGNLATYFGFASELSDLKSKNPNLNFDIAPIPQPKNTTKRVSYARMYGFSIAKSAKDPNGTLTVLKELLTAPVLAHLTTTTYLPPVRRDLITTGTSDPYLKIFYDAALIAKGWLDPNPYSSYRILQTLVESVVSGRLQMQQAIEQANNEINLLLRQ